MGEITAKSLAKILGAEILDDLEDESTLASTGCVPLDYLLEGGIPAGLITEIVGDFSTGKSLIGLQLCREVIRAGGIGVYLDSENALNKNWAVDSLDINPEELIYLTAFSLEKTYEKIKEVCKEAKTDRPVMIVWDTIAASQPDAITISKSSDSKIKKDYSPIGLAARKNSENMPEIVKCLRESGASLVILNQLRSKIGVLFGQKWESCGGRAIRFYSSLRLHMTKRGKIKQGGICTGITGCMEVIKSRRSKPFTKVEFDVDFNSGIDPWSGMTKLLTKAGIVAAIGGVYKFKGSKKSFKSADLPQIYKEIWDLALEYESLSKGLV